MAETWFDNRDGTLIVGQAAYDSVIEAVQSGYPADYVVPLPDLLTLKRYDYPYGRHDYESTDEPLPTREDCLVIGHWITKLVRQAEGHGDDLINTTHLRTMRLLGLSPSPHAFEHIGSIAVLRQELGQPVTKAMAGFMRWTPERFASYAARLAAELGRKPTVEDYDAAAKDGKGKRPPGTIIAKQCGGLQDLHEAIGYPNFANWDADDCLDWGARVMRVNQTSYFTDRVIQLLSAKDVGPPLDLIREHFGTIRRFRRLSRCQAVRDKEDQHETENYLLKLFDKYRPQAANDDTNAPAVGFDRQQRLAYAAKYEVAQACAPQASHDRLAQLSLLKPSLFISGIISANHLTDSAKIEIHADYIGYFDYIWPPPDYSHRLRFTAEELQISPATLRRRRLAG